ncbi:MAG TPA: hypothetical protein VJ600_06645 [Holophagaceae bacterium]|nr:hypothetical protein [Holophagaceae bacterium]
MRIALLLALGLLQAADANAQGVKPAASPQSAPVVVQRNPQDPNATKGPGARVTSHRATLQVTAVADTDATLQGWTQAGGQRAYGLIVPPGGKVTVRLRHAKAGYFHIGRKWVHNLGYIPERCLSGDPMNCFNNPTDKPIDVYFIVSDPSHWADEKAPFTLEFTRSWKPGADTGGVKLREQLKL